MWTFGCIQMKTFVINAMMNKSKIIPRGREIDEEWGKNVSMLHRVIPTLLTLKTNHMLSSEPGILLVPRSHGCSGWHDITLWGHTPSWCRARSLTERQLNVEETGLAWKPTCLCQQWGNHGQPPSSPDLFSCPFNLGVDGLYHPNPFPTEMDSVISCEYHGTQK